MAFTTKEEVRASTNKLDNATKGVSIDDTVIDNRIAEASDILIGDLSKVASQADLEAMGSASKVLNQMATYKAVQLCLVYKMGASRSVDTVTDIQYWERQYTVLLQKVLNSKVDITDGTESLSSVSVPVATPNGNNAKMFPEKGVPGFINDGAKTDIVEDRIK